MNFSQPKNILISGASSGIGKHLAFVYAKPNINLFLCGRNKYKLLEVKTLCENLGAKTVIKNFDVTDLQASSDFIAEIEQNFAIDLLIANAGISGSMNGIEEDFATAQKILKTNIDGVLNLIHPAIEKMKQRRHGQIAVVSSLAGFCGVPSSPAYSASKAAIRIYAEGLRGNLSPYGIAVNAICPGYVATPMVAENKFWMPFLISPQKAARAIKKGLEKNQSRIAFPFLVYFSVWFGALFFRRPIDFIISRISRKIHKES